MTPYSFFRRPMKYNWERSVIETSPCGGICIAIRDMQVVGGQKQCTVSYSICPMDVPFNRNIARAKATANEGKIINVPAFNVDIVLDTYLEQHHDHDLWIARNRIALSPFIAEEQRQFHQEAIEALKIKERYHDLNER